MKKMIYIHIGGAKTGTSAIQAFMNYNREKLSKDYSVLYPNFDSLFLDRGRYHNHCRLINSMDISTAQNLIQDAIRHSNRKNINSIVLSCEGFIAHERVAGAIYQAVEGAENLECVIIAYLRRQDHWFESAWKQWGIKNQAYKTIEEYILKTKIDYLAHLDKWSDTFGKKNVIVHAYEKEQLPGGLISDFLQLIGIDIQSGEWTTPPSTNVNENYGFNRDVVELLRLNRGLFEHVHDNRPFNFFSHYLGDDYKKNAFENYSFLSPVQRIKILEEYEPMNKTIAQKYMGRMDGRLFYEPWPKPDEPWEPYKGLTVEKVVPIFTQLLYNMDVEYQRQFRNFRKNAQKKDGIWKKLDLSLKATKRRIKKLSK